MAETKQTTKQTKVITEPQIKITQLELMGKLFTLNGSEIVTIYTNTDARLRKTSKVDKTIRNPYPNARKVSKVNGLFNIDYANCVNNQLEREEKDDNFEAASRKWGERVLGSKVLLSKVKTDKDGNNYTEYYFQFNPRNHYYTKYKTENGNEIEKADIEDFILTKSKSSRQGTDTEIVWRTYKISSITAIKMNKVLYIIEN